MNALVSDIPASAELATTEPPHQVQMAALQRPAAEFCVRQIQSFVNSVGQTGVATQLTRDELARALAARADATLEALGFDLECFRRYCLATGAKGIPAHHETVARYIERLWQLGPVVAATLPGQRIRKTKPLKAASITRRLASIAMLHQLLHLDNPCAESNVRNAMRVARREIGTAQRQAAPVRLEAASADGQGAPQGAAGFTLDALLGACDDSLSGLRDAAMISMAYDGGLRVSELTGLPLSAIKGLERGEGPGSLILAKSKTDQEGKGEEVSLSADTMRRLRAWVDASGIGDEPDLPVCRRIRATVRKGNKGRPARRYDDLAPNAGFSMEALKAIPPRATEIWCEVGEGGLSRAGVTMIYRRVAQRAADQGLVELSGEALEAAIKAISTHSMRVGLTQDLFKLGLDSVHVTEALRWKDPKTALRYARNRPSAERKIADALARLRS